MKIYLNANQTNRLDIQGTYVRLLDAAGPVTVTVGNDRTRQTLEMERGTGFEPAMPFTYVELLSTVSQQVTIAIANGRIDDNRLSGYVETKPQTSQNLITRLVTGIIGDPVLIAAGDGGRRRLIIHNDGPDPARVGGALDVVANGMVLTAGEKLITEFAAAAEYYAVSTTANAVSIRVLEETDTYATGQQPPADAVTTENGAYLYTESGDYIIQ